VLRATATVQAEFEQPKVAKRVRTIDSNDCRRGAYRTAAAKIASIEEVEIERMPGDGEPCWADPPSTRLRSPTSGRIS
jgi:hypothetical protein